MTAGAVTIVVPCHNEAARLPQDEVQVLADAGVDVLLVDDGSIDGTAAVLRRLAQRDGIRVLVLPRNVGKAEAVRHGLIHALATGPSIVGYADADFATPAGEVLRLLDLLEAAPDLDGVLGSRVLLADRTIRRRPVRHVLGRAVATYLSLRYALTIYDTQCGAKLFRAGESFSATLQAPFVTRWLFDVELLLRLRALLGDQLRLREEPLDVWTDVPGSHIGLAEVRQVLSDFTHLDRRSRGAR